MTDVEQSFTNADEQFMAQALALADTAEELGEVPVGAIVVRDGLVIGRGWNRPITGHDPTAHAEIMAMRDAAAQEGNYRLPGSTLYVTLEPCSMCAGAIVHARIETVVFAAFEPKAGVVKSNGDFFASDFLNHKVLAKGGLLQKESSEKLSAFFAARRELKKSLKAQAAPQQNDNEC